MNISYYELGPLVERALKLLRQGSPAKALEILHQVRDEDSKFGQGSVPSLMAEAYEELGNLEEAETWYLEATNLNSSMYNYQTNYIHFLLDQGREDEVQAHMNTDQFKRYMTEKDVQKLLQGIEERKRAGGNASDV